MDFPVSENASTNPLLWNAPNSICIVCNKRLENIRTVSVQEKLPHYEPPISLFEGLKLLTNFGMFGDVNIDNVPQQACSTCFLNTDGFLRFRQVCHNAADNIRDYILNQERIQKYNVRAETECNASTSLDDNVNSRTSYQDALSAQQLKEWNEMMEIKKKILKTSHEKVQCTVCQKIVKKASLRYHMDIHTTDTYPCKYCGKRFASLNRVYIHTRYTHEAYKCEPHLCSFCGKNFTNASRLNDHIKTIHTVSDVRSFVCEICRKAFKTTNQLRTHSRVHSDEKNFQCEKCAKRFHTQKCLKQHSVTHAEVRPFECTSCGKRFTQQQHLKYHQARACKGLHSQANTSQAQNQSEFCNAVVN